MYTILYPVKKLDIGEAEQQLLELVRGLDKEVFHPVVTPLYSGGGLEDEFRAVAGIEVISLNQRGKYDPSPLWKMTRILWSRQIDIIQSYLCPATFFGLLPAVTCDRAMTVVTELVGDCQSCSRGSRAHRIVEYWFTRFADTIVTNSPASQRMLVARGLPPSKMRVIYNGVNLHQPAVSQETTAVRRAEIGSCDDALVAGMLTHPTRDAGQTTAIHAIAQLNCRRPQVRLAIGGDGPLRVELEALAAELNISDRVTFFDDRINVFDILTTFDVLISSSSDCDSYSNSILEAMALGIPVISTSINDNRELITPGESEWIVDPDDPTALAEALERTIVKPDQMTEISNCTRDRVYSQFGVARMVDDFEELYRELLSQPIKFADADGRLVALKT